MQGVSSLWQRLLRPPPSLSGTTLGCENIPPSCAPRRRRAAAAVRAHSTVPLRRVSLTSRSAETWWMCGPRAFPKWRSERGCDSRVPSLCRCLCSRPRPRQRSTSAPRTAQLETKSGRVSRSSSRSYRPCSCSWPSPSSTGTSAGTDRSFCCCTSCSSDPSSGQCCVVYLHGSPMQRLWTPLCWGNSAVSRDETPVITSRCRVHWWFRPLMFVLAAHKLLTDRRNAVVVLISSGLLWSAACCCSECIWHRPVTLEIKGWSILPIDMFHIPKQLFSHHRVYFPQALLLLAVWSHSTMISAGSDLFMSAPPKSTWDHQRKDAVVHWWNRYRPALSLCKSWPEPAGTSVWATNLILHVGNLPFSTHSAQYGNVIKCTNRGDLNLLKARAFMQPNYSWKD